MAPETRKGKGALPFGVAPEIVILGIVSFLTDVSSEMIFSVLSVFMTAVLGISTVLVGVLEGAADFASSALDYLSGCKSDISGKRKPLAVAGYSISTVAKAVLALFSSAWSCSGSSTGWASPCAAPPGTRSSRR